MSESGARVRGRCNAAAALCAALAFVLAAEPAAAQRPDARAMSCAQARALVVSRGAVVLTTGQHTFDRFVATHAYCTHGEVLKRAWITTGDGRCNVGYLCRQPFPRPRE